MQHFSSSTYVRRPSLMRRLMQTVIAALIMLGVLGLPLSNTAHAQEAVNLRFTVWVGPGAALDMLNGIAAAYTAKNANVTVQFDTIPFNDYTSKLTLQLAGSNPPDGGWILENTAPQFIASGVLTDLTPTLNSADYDFADFESSALKLWQADGITYSLPFSTSPFLVIYNADMFRAAGLETPNALYTKGEWTWEKLAESAKAISTSQNVYGFESVDANVYKPGGFWTMLTPIIRAYGGDTWKADNTCGLTSAESVAAVSLYHKMAFADKSTVPPGEAGDFYTGKSAMTIGQISRLAKLDKATFAWDIAPLPLGPAGEAPTTGQAALAVFANSRNTAVALDFLAFLTNRDNSLTMGQFFPSARKSVLNSDTFLNGNSRLKADQMKLVVDGISKGRVLAAHPNFSQIALASNAIFDELWTADADIPAVMAKACEVIQPLLSQ